MQIRNEARAQLCHGLLRRNQVPIGSVDPYQEVPERALLGRRALEGGEIPLLLPHGAHSGTKGKIASGKETNRDHPWRQ
jgi:hypothetical protein